jgi:hypothetical protein
MIDLLHAYLWVIGLVIFIVLYYFRGLNAVATLIGHFILKVFGREKEQLDKGGDISVLVGYGVMALIWIVASVHPWTWWVAGGA